MWPYDITYELPSGPYEPMPIGVAIFLLALCVTWVGIDVALERAKNRREKKN